MPNDKIFIFGSHFHVLINILLLFDIFANMEISRNLDI